MELDSGTITIDGTDIASLGLKQLRTRLSIIPQEPVLFTGTLRSNLDPLGEYDSDEILWDALRRAKLANWVRDTCQPLGLLAPVHEGGSNLAAGERQLLCLARALLRVRSGCRVLVLDEATAAVDQATDDMIQATIRREFADCTTLTIAHRLRTIIDSDKILVLDAGALLEFDSPKALLSDPTSAFGRMVDDTGPQNARSLRAVAFGETDVAAAFGAADTDTDTKGTDRAASWDSTDAALPRRALSLFSSLTHLHRRHSSGAFGAVTGAASSAGAGGIGPVGPGAVPLLMGVRDALVTLQVATAMSEGDDNTALLSELEQLRRSPMEWMAMLAKYLGVLHQSTLQQLENMEAHDTGEDNTIVRLKEEALYRIGMR